MGVPGLLCWAGACPQDHCTPSARLSQLATSSCQLCWCLADKPSAALWSSECYLSSPSGWHLCLIDHVVPLLTSSRFPWQVPLWHCQ